MRCSVLRAALLLAALLANGPPASAATLRDAMERFAHDVSRAVRRIAGGPVFLVGVDGPFTEAATPLVWREFVVALEASGVETSRRPTPVTLGLEYRHGEEPGRFTARAEVRSADERLRRVVESTFEIDDAVDRAILEGLSYDATTNAAGEPRIATRAVVRAALVDNAATVTDFVADGEPDEETSPGDPEVSVVPAIADGETGRVLVNVQPDGRVVVTTGDTRIVIESARERSPSGSQSAKSPRSAKPAQQAERPKIPQPARKTKSPRSRRSERKRGRRERSERQRTPKPRADRTPRRDRDRHDASQPQRRIDAFERTR